MFCLRQGVWIGLIAAAIGCNGSGTDEAVQHESATTGAPHRILYQSERDGGVDVWLMNGMGRPPCPGNQILSDARRRRRPSSLLRMKSARIGFETEPRWAPHS